MAKPTQAKEPETKDKEPQSGGNSILINVITTTIVCIIFIGVNYFLQSNLLTTQLKSVTTEQAAEDDSEQLDKPEKGIVLDLGDFTMNLSDVDPRRYLKANVAVEITNPEPETQAEEPKNRAVTAVMAKLPHQTPKQQLWQKWNSINRQSETLLLLF